jgi:hypothetical protein
MTSGDGDLSGIIQGLEVSQIVKTNTGEKRCTLVPDRDYVTMTVVAALTFLLWDLCITFEDELQNVWCSKWKRRRFKHLLYFLVRYFPILSQMYGQNLFLPDA